MNHLKLLEALEALKAAIADHKKEIKRHEAAILILQDQAEKEMDKYSESEK